jgi:hypothetical protein
MPSPTVSVEPVKDYPALIMKWHAYAKPEDIKRAYRVISDALDAASGHLYIIVDLRENKQMPLKETVSGALFGPYNHRNLAAWFVLGGHQIARVVANSLAQVTRQHRVDWFDTEEDVYNRLKELTQARH